MKKLPEETLAKLRDRDWLAQATAAATDEQVAAELGVYRLTITKYRKQHGLKLRGPRKQFVKAPQLADADWLRAMAADKTDVEIAAIVGVSMQAVQRWRTVHGIPSIFARPRLRDAEYAERTAVLRDRAWLEEASRRASIHEIAGWLKCKAHKVDYWRRKFGILPHQSTNALAYRTKLGDATWLAEQVALRRTYREIGAEIGCSRTTVQEAMSTFGIRATTHGRRPKPNPASEPATVTRPKKPTKTKREATRMRGTRPTTAAPALAARAAEKPAEVIAFPAWASVKRSPESRLADFAWLQEQIKTKSDETLATELECRPEMVVYWRTRYALPAGPLRALTVIPTMPAKHPGRRARFTIENRQRLKDRSWLEQQAATRSDWLIAKELGCAEHIVKLQREAYGIAGASAENHPLRNGQKLAELCQLYTDAEIAEQLDVAERTVRFWRAEHRIKRNRGTVKALKPLGMRKRAIDMAKPVERDTEDADEDDERDPTAAEAIRRALPRQRSPINPIVGTETRSLLISCPACKWTTDLTLLRIGTTDRWQPEPDQKIQFTPGVGFAHRSCGSMMHLYGRFGESRPASLTARQEVAR